MAELIIHAGKLQGKRLVFPEREIVVGRDEDCELRLTSSLVSRRHCVLDVQPDGIWVRDLSSQNGTYINDVAVTDRLLLKPGDVLRIGAAVFQVPELEPPHKPKKRAAEKISDADIADWLTDDDHNTAPKSSDTTVIQGRAAMKSETSSQVSPAAIGSSTTDGGSSVIRRVAASAVPKSVKEEAAEIIRLHWESVRATRPE